MTEAASSWQDLQSNLGYPQSLFSAQNLPSLSQGSPAGALRKVRAVLLPETQSSKVGGFENPSGRGAVGGVGAGSHLLGSPQVTMRQG